MPTEEQIKETAKFIFNKSFPGEEISQIRINTEKMDFYVKYEARIEDVRGQNYLVPVDPQTIYEITGGL